MPSTKASGAEGVQEPAGIQPIEANDAAEWGTDEGRRGHGVEESGSGYVVIAAPPPPSPPPYVMPEPVVPVRPAVESEFN